MDKRKIISNNIRTATCSSRSYDKENRSVVFSREFIEALTKILFDKN